MYLSVSFALSFPLWHHICMANSYLVHTNAYVKSMRVKCAAISSPRTYVQAISMTELTIIFPCLMAPPNDNIINIINNPHWLYSHKITIKPKRIKMYKKKKKQNTEKMKKWKMSEGRWGGGNSRNGWSEREKERKSEKKKNNNNIY